MGEGVGNGPSHCKKGLSCFPGHWEKGRFPWFVFGGGSSPLTTTSSPGAQGREPEAQTNLDLESRPAWAQVSEAQQLCDLGQVAQPL